MKFTATVQQHDNEEELFIEFPEEIMQELGWKEGDTLNWHINQKEIIITKIENTTTIKKEHIQTNNNITQDYTFNQKEILQ